MNEYMNKYMNDLMAKLWKGWQGQQTERRQLGFREVQRQSTPPGLLLSRGLPGNALRSDISGKTALLGT